MIIATAGHVDHGKTLLVTRLTGIETDRLAEEKARGLTIDLGFAYINDEFGNRLGFVDVPGHTRFVSNMLAGVSAVDYALLIVAADDGPMPQTFEHLAILDLLGLDEGLIVVTKIDRVEPARVAEVTAAIKTMVAGTTLANADIVPVSSITGEGIEDLSIALAAAAEEMTSRDRKGHFRLAVDRCFTVKGAGLVVTGSVFAGHVSVGDELTLLPQRETVRVRSLHRQNEDASQAGAGDRCAINLTGRQLERDEVSRGDWLDGCSTRQSTLRVDLELKLLKTETTALKNGSTVHVHAAASRNRARVATLGGSSIAPSSTGLVQLILTSPLHLCQGDRLVIRDAAATRTIGGGSVLDPLAPARGREKPERLAQLKLLQQNCSADNYLLGFQLGLTEAQFTSALNLTPEEVERVVAASAIVRLDDCLLHQSKLQDLTGRFLVRLDEWHRQNPQKRGISVGEARRLLPRACRFHRALLARLVEEGALQMMGSQYSLPGYVATLSESTLKIWAQAEPILQDTGIKPPVLHDLAKTLNETPQAVDKALKECMKAGYVKRPAENRYFTPAAMEELRVLLSSAADGQPFTVKQYRDISGIGRNLCIEILEYFDRQKVTRRLGDLREILES